LYFFNVSVPQQFPERTKMDRFKRRKLFAREPSGFLPAACGGGQVVRSSFVSWIYGLNSVK